MLYLVENEVKYIDLRRKIWNKEKKYIDLRRKIEIMKMSNLMRNEIIYLL